MKTGLITCAAAGTKYTGPALPGGGTRQATVMLQGHPGNTAAVTVFGVGDADGYPLAAGQEAPVVVGTLAELQFSSTAANQKVCFLVVG